MCQERHFLINQAEIVKAFPEKCYLYPCHQCDTFSDLLEFFNYNKHFRTVDVVIKCARKSQLSL